MGPELPEAYPSPRLLVLFGSQTGKAWYIAQDIYLNCRTAFRSDLVLSCFSLEQFQRNFWIHSGDFVVFVVATVGEGECSYSAVQFWDFLQHANHPPNLLSKVSYGLFALGDSNYHHFAIFGKQLDQRLLELGARQICPTGYGDDAEGVEVGYSPWLQSFIESLTHQLPCDEQFLKRFKGSGRKLMPLNEMDFSSIPPNELTLPVAPKDKLVETSIKDEKCNPMNEDLSFPKMPLMDTDPLEVKLVDLRLISRPTEFISREDKVILEATFEGDEEFVGWVPGDAFGFIVGHSDFEVNLVLRALKLQDKADCLVSVESKSHLYLPKEVTLFNLIKFYFDLRSTPKKANLRLFGDYCSSPSQRLHLHFLSSREGSEEYKKQILKNKTTILDILVNYDSCSPPLDQFISIVPNFLPRFYSVLNEKNDKNQFKVAFTVVFHKEINQRQDTQLLGLFTGLMYRIALRKDLLEDSNFPVNSSVIVERFRVFRKKNDHFKLKTDLKLPIIMIAAGTGVTPFLGFLSSRQRTKKNEPVGESFIFYGCRDASKDFIYGKELDKFNANGTLTGFFACFSRDPDSRFKHVQDAISSERKELRRLIVESNAVIYVCGDLGKFSVDVRAALAEALDATAAEGDPTGSKTLDELRGRGHYLQDIWV